MSDIKNKSKALFNGTIIYFIGNILTQLISIVLLKYITGTVTKSDYGYFNLIVTIDNLVTPMITLQISDAVFRFFIKSESMTEKKDIYSTGTSVILLGIVISTVLVAVFKDVFHIEYAVWVAMYIISTNIFGYNQKVVRSLKRNKLYVIANLLKTILYFLFLVVFVFTLKLGAKGLLISNCISTYICILIIIVRIQSYKYFSIKNISALWFKKMLYFSAPLIPNTAIWWMHSSINSLILSSQLGLEYNGIYTVANKFAAVLHLIINVFDLAWQESAITEYGSDGYREFTTKTFNKYIVFLFSGVIVVIPLLNILAPFLIDQEYYDALPFIPYLLISTGLSACSGYFAQMITARNQNVRLLTTNIVGAIANIIIVVTMTRILGIWAIVISVMVSNLFLTISRFKVVKMDFLNNRINYRLIALMIVLSVGMCIVYYLDNHIISIVALIAGSIIVFFSNKDLIFAMFDYLKILSEERRKI